MALPPDPDLHQELRARARAAWLRTRAFAGLPDPDPPGWRARLVRLFFRTVGALRVRR